MDNSKLIFLNTLDLLEIASNPKSTIKQLASLVDKHFEVNRELAKNPKVTQKILRQIAEYWVDELDDYDLEAQRLIAQHPNTPADLLVKFGRKFPSELLTNPSLKELTLKKPTFLDQFSGLVRLPECPEPYLRRIIEGEADLLKLDMLRNPKLPVDIRQKLTPDYFFSRAQYLLEAFAADRKNAEFGKYVEAYSKNSQSYCIPMFVPFDKNNRDHRLGDQVIRGFPFTSKNWPWPLTSEVKPMQPLAQINLENAGELLGVDLGCGLLQVWAKRTLDPVIRIIPVAAFDEDLDSFYPTAEPWNIECGDESEDVVLFYLYLSQMRYPRVEWIRAGQMYPAPFHSMKDWCEENTKFSVRKQEQLSERIEKLGIPMMERGDDATCWVHLGGYPSGYGNEGGRCDWSGKKERLLLYVRDGVDCVIFTMQLMVSLNGEGKPTFQAFITCDD